MFQASRDAREGVPNAPAEDALSLMNEEPVSIRGLVSSSPGSVRPVPFHGSYSRLKPGLRQATIRYPIEKTQDSGIRIEKDG